MAKLDIIGHSQADTQVINATPILLFLDLGQDGDGNGTLMQCACMTGAPVGMWTWGRVHTKFWQPH